MAKKVEDVRKWDEEKWVPFYGEVKIKRCRDGYVVEFETLAARHLRIQERRVFTLESDMLKFVENYFKGDPFS